MITRCPHCQTRVIPSETGYCPACRMPIDPSTKGDADADIPAADHTHAPLPTKAEAGRGGLGIQVPGILARILPNAISRPLALGLRAVLSLVGDVAVFIAWCVFMGS